MVRISKLEHELGMTMPCSYDMCPACHGSSSTELVRAAYDKAMSFPAFETTFVRI